MAGRLLSWPNGVHLSNLQIMSGPASSGGSESAGSIPGAAQYVSAPLSPWVFSVTTPLLQGQAARRMIGTLIASHKGANAISLPWSRMGEQIDPLDLELTASQELNWSNGEPWDNGRGWSGGYPTETVSAAQSINYSIVELGDSAWGDKLGLGDWVGFVGHYAVYMVTEVFPLDPGKYRIWPPLRKAITTIDVATLEPTIVARTVGEIPMSKNPAYWDGIGITIVEIPDKSVRDYYTLP